MASYMVLCKVKTMTEDIFYNLQKEVKTEEVKKALELAYWRGVQNHKDSPKEIEDLRVKLILKDLKNFT